MLHRVYSIEQPDWVKEKLFTPKSICTTEEGMQHGHRIPTPYSLRNIDIEEQAVFVTKGRTIDVRERKI